MLVGNYEEIREVKAVKSASAVMFTVELVFSYLSLAVRRVFSAKRGKTKRRVGFIVGAVLRSISVKSRSSPPAGRALA